jgi:hypothetical protein
VRSKDHLGGEKMMMKILCQSGGGLGVMTSMKFLIPSFDTCRSTTCKIAGDIVDFNPTLNTPVERVTEIRYASYTFPSRTAFERDP